MFAGFPICADAIAFVLLECEDQRVAARVLGFDFYSWFSSKAPQPASTEKTWIERTDEKNQHFWLWATLHMAGILESHIRVTSYGAI